MHDDIERWTIQNGCTDQMTGRQKQVLGLLAHGYTNARIGSELGISLDGAKWHVGEVLGTLGFDSRTEAARWLRCQIHGRFAA